MFIASIIAVALVGQMIVPEVNYDKFNDTTSMRMNLGKLPDEEECDSCVAIVAFYPGKKPKIDSLKDDVADVDLEVRLAFYRHDGGQKYGAYSRSEDDVWRRTYPIEQPVLWVRTLG